MTGESAPAAPTLTIGLPVYNGENYLRQSLEALLAQTFPDFELVISDNASTDSTADICQEFASLDPRIRYVRQVENIGAGPNHNILVPHARGRYFKWASHDDLYAPDLVERCVGLLQTNPQAVLAHAWDAVIDAAGETVYKEPYALDTTNPDPAARLRSLLYVPGGNDFYGVIRTDVLRNVGEHGSYYNADRVFVAGLALRGAFVQVPEVLYLRRDHAGRATRAGDRRARAAALEPRRADRLRHPMVRMYAEYVGGYVDHIRRARLTSAERRRCLAEVGTWLASCLSPRRQRVSLEERVVVS
jgi:glycosyltransferase involved in cell wall biosynthesis